MEVSEYDISELAEGMSVHYTTRFTRENIDTFAALSGDVSPLHVNQDFGKSSQFGVNLVHGLLISAHFSTLIGVFLPGKRALLTGLNVEFVQPVPVDSEVTLSASIVSVSKSQQAVSIRLLAFLDGQICIEGQARVKLLESTN